MNIEIWVAYFSATVIYSLIPGSGTINSINNGMVYGFRKSVISIVGLQLGLAFYIILIGMGVGVLVSQSAIAFTVIKWVGVAYLIWLGIQKFRENTPTNPVGVPLEISEWKLFSKAIVVNLSNPKTVIFFAALLPQFIDPAGSHNLQIIQMGATTIAVDTCVMLLYVILAAKLSYYIRSPRIVKKLNRIFGSMFISCGALLAAAKA
ncbi:homoserine/homoserine lactone efflux protein [Photobacterium lutimaris]|uniref:Homoserine/homoserine lactone efflux protein n=1 Tax=Photobacterium lutimaris TaxID=388278 RepID=A0A2T3IZ70_9GAMM|nr:homoserine/homoserine lactone efflux protein [Photobacterium lutimaris]PSU33934.1 homoserine/homoserine lactone efflux protein [Photobacterium lutimaris]TDR76268.1 homoserine/homoserine lactone efflux protein [Photobacterium lutimaris]